MICKHLSICDNVIIDRRTNKTSLINLHVDITPVALPIIIPRLVIFAHIEKEISDDDRTTLYLRISLNDEEIIKQPMEINFVTKTKARVISELGGLTIEESGNLNVEILTQEAVQLASTIVQIELPIQPQVNPVVEEG